MTLPTPRPRPARNCRPCARRYLFSSGARSSTGKSLPKQPRQGVQRAALLHITSCAGLLPFLCVAVAGRASLASRLCSSSRRRPLGYRTRSVLARRSGLRPAHRPARPPRAPFHVWPAIRAARSRRRRSWHQRTAASNAPLLRPPTRRRRSVTCTLALWSPQLVQHLDTFLAQSRCRLPAGRGPTRGAPRLLMEHPPMARCAKERCGVDDASVERCGSNYAGLWWEEASQGSSAGLTLASRKKQVCSLS